MGSKEHNTTPKENTMTISMNQIKTFTRAACEACGCPELFDKINYECSNRLTNSMGRAQVKNRIVQRWHPDKGLHRKRITTYTMKLSTKIWARANQEEQEDTIIHEACHLIDYYKNGRMNGHGRVWKRLMRECGINTPKRCHDVDLTGLTQTRRKQPRHTVYCKCENGTEMGNTQYKRMLRGTNYTCKKCKTKVTKEPQLTIWAKTMRIK